MHYYAFAIKLERFFGSCNSLNDPSNNVCIPNKTEDLNKHVFNIITGKNQSKIWQEIYLANVIQGKKM